MTTPANVLPIPWYEAADYARLRAAMTDGASLPTRYADWRMSAEQVEGEARRVGLAVVRVTLSPEAFLAWCAAQGRAPDGVARRAFVQEGFQERAGSPSP